MSAAREIVARFLIAGAVLLGLGVRAASAQSIDATTYPFTAATGVALEDMSSGSTQLIGPDVDSGVSALVPIGFDFWFSGSRQTSFSVSSNGLLRVGSVAPSTSTNSLGSILTAPQIAPYWDHLMVGTNGKVHYRVVGTAPNRKLVVEWLDMQVPRLGSSGPGAATFQCWLYETTGQIQFVYGGGIVTNALESGASIGLGSTDGTFASVTSVSSSVSYGMANNSNTSPIPSGTSYTFAPPLPAAPASLSFSQVGALGMTLAWVDNASNEAGYAVWRSTDGVQYDFVTQASADVTSLAQTGLNPATTYYWIVRAVSSGALSDPLAGSQATGTSGAIVTAGSGNWSSTVPGAPWPGGIVPTASDAVTIADGHTVTVDAAANCYSLTVGQGASGVLQFEPATARTLTVVGGVTVSPGAVLAGPASGTQTGHSLSLGGSVTNLGTLDLSTNSNQAGVGLTFTGSSNASLTGAGAVTDVRAVTVNKGTSATLTLDAPGFKVRGQTADTLGFLTLTSGTFHVAGTFAMSSEVFTTAAYNLPTGATFWLDNPNFTVIGQAGSPTVRALRISAGLFQVGTLSDHSLILPSGSQVTVEGGELRTTGRMSVNSSTAAISYVQTGGTVTVDTKGSTSTSLAAFDLGTAATSSTTISGGTIVLRGASTASSGPRDYRNSAGIQSVTGGTLQVGSDSTGAVRTFFISGATPNLVVSNLSGGHTARLSAATTVVGSTQIAPGATLDLNGFRFTQSGGNLANDGTLTGSAANSELYFLGSGTPQSYSGAGSVPGLLSILSADNPSGVTISPANAANIVVRQVNLIRGVLANSQKLTLGNADAQPAVTQVGGSGVTGTGGSYDAPPAFNPGTGGVSVSYLQEGAPRTTGFEIPASRQLRDLTLNHPGGTVTVAGGPLTLARGLTLTAGLLKTDATQLVTLGDTASVVPSGSAQSYVDGPLALTLRTPDTVAIARTFAVGRDGAFRPLALSGVLTGGTSQVLTAEVLAGPTGGTPTPPLQSLSTARYWRLGNTAGLNTSARVLLSFGTDDYVGDLANVRVAQSAAASGGYSDRGGSTAGFQSNGTVTSTADLAPGFDYFVVATAGSFAKVWDGGAGTSNWGDAANWNPDGVPDTTTDVTLSASAPTTLTVAGNFTVKDLTVASNVTLQVNSGTLAITGDYVQSGGAVQLASSAITVGRYTTLLGGTLNLGAGSFTSGNFVDITGGSMSISSGSFLADSSFAIEGGTVSLNSGVLELKYGFWRTSGNFFSGTGTTIFSGTLPQFIGGGNTYYNLDLRNGGAGSPKNFEGFLTHIVNNDLVVESTAQMAVTGSSTTTLTVWGNVQYSGIAGGTSIGNMSLFLAGTGKTISGSLLGAPALVTKVDDPPPPLSDVPVTQVDMLTDPVRAQHLPEERDGKPLLVLENTYEKRKAQVEQLLRTADPGKRLVINLDDMTIVKNPEPIRSLAAVPGPADLSATTSFPMTVTVQPSATYALGGSLSMGSSRTLTVSGRLDCGAFTVSGAGKLTLNTLGVLGTATTSATGLAATVVTTGGNTYNDGSVIDYDAAGDQTINAANHPAAAMIRTSGGGTKTLNAAKALTASSGSALANGALFVGAGTTFNDGGFRLSLTTTQIANVIVQGGYTSTGSGSLSFESGAFSSNIQAANGTAFGDLLMNFTSSTLSVDMNAVGAANVSFRNLTFGGSAGTANNGGTLKLSETGTTNVTVTGSVSIAPRTTSATGGGFDGTSGRSGQATLLGDLTSTSVATTQPIMGNTGTNKLVLAGSSRQTLTLPVSATAFTGSTLKLASAAGVALAGSGLTYTIGLGGAVDLGAGNINTGTNTLALAAGDPLTRTTGRVVGRLKKGVLAGPGTATFEIGTETQDATVSLAFGNVSVAGNLSALTTASDHPNIGTSSLDATKSVNRYYNVTNEGVGFDTCAVALTFPATDVDAGADPNKFALRKFDSPAWSATVVSARSPTSIQTRRITSFSDFAIGEGTSFYLGASAGANGTISPAGTTLVAAGASQAYTLTPAAHYHVADLVVDGASSGPAASYTFTGVGADHSIVASFATDTNVITASAGANGGISPAGAISVPYGASQGFTITPNTGYHVADVQVDGSSVGAVTSYTFTNVTATHTVAASFAINLYTVSASAGTNGSISPSGAVAVAHGSSQAFAVTPATGYHVANVLVDGSSVGAVTGYTFTNVTAAHTIAASFAINQYTITPSAGPHGTISPSGPAVVAHGANGPTYTMLPDSGYVVTDVLVDGTSVGAVTSYAFTNVTADHAIAVSFGPSGQITFGPASATISTANVCVTVPVGLVRTFATPVRGYSVKFTLSPNLTLCAGTASITEGTYLDSGWTTSFHVTSNGGGTYTVDDVIVGTACGPTAPTGSLFNVAVTSSAPGGAGSITVNSVKLRACDNTVLYAIGPTPTSVSIDNTPPAVALLGPAGGEVFVGGGSTTITWTASDPEGTAGIDLAYSTDGGLTYPNAIATGIANTGSYHWIIPAATSSTARVRVTAHDVNGNTAAAASAANFELRPSNTAPVIAGVPASATIPERVPYTFTATASDADVPAQTVKLSLVGGPAGASFDSTSGVFSWTPSEAQGPGSYAFKVRATDGIDTSLAAVTLTVTEANTVPGLAGVPASATIPELAPYTFTASATDADLPAQPLRFSLVGAPAGAAIDSTSGAFSWTPSEAQGPGSYPFTVRVTDGVANTDAAITLAVTEVNAAPVRSGVPASASIPELAPYTFTASATDADLPVQPLRFSLVGAPAGAAIDSTSGVFSWTPTEAQGPGSYPFTVRVTDGVANTDAAIALAVTEVNVAPVLSGVPAAATIPELSAYTFTAGAADSDVPAQPLRFSLVGAPAGAAIDSTSGAFSWTPSEAQGPGSYPFTVRVTDGVANTDAAIALAVTEVNVAPVLSGVPAAATIPEQAPYTFTASASDADLPAQTLTFSLVGAPLGASIAGSTGVFSWTPSESQGPGTYPFTVRVSDGVADVDAPITVTVTDVNVAPVLSGVAGSATIPELSPYTFTASATDSDLPAQTLTFSLVGAPLGAGIDGATGAFSWTPAEAQGPGSYPFTVRVSDGIANVDVAITLHVTESNQAPALSGVPASATIPELAPYTFTASASDADLPAQTLTFSLVGAPSGAAIDGSTGAFSWTPTEAQGPGSYPFSVRVSDGTANVDAPITLTVTEVNTAPVLTGVPASATIVELSPYAFTATATDPDLPAQTLTFSLIGAPAGASINSSTGVFSWTPADAQGPGTYPFTVRVSDGPTQADAAITLTVLDANTPPVLSGVPASATMPELSAYTFTASATDSDVPVQTLTYSLVGAPAGATIGGSNGVFSWTPTETQGPGTYPFAVRVSDGVANTDAAITLTVTEVNAAPVLSGVPASATTPELSAYTFTATATDSDMPAQALTWALVGAPTGATINGSTGAFSWTPTEAQGPASYPFTVRVTDGVTNTDAAITLDVTEVNVAPVLAGVPASASLPELSPYTFTATATDADLPAQTLTFSLVGAPSGATIDGTTGAFSWTPSEAQGPGSYPFTVRLSDGTANTDAAITLAVTEVDQAPVLAGVPASASIPELSPYTFTATATDADVPAQLVTFSLVGAPAGATIDGTTGAFSWTPTEAQGPGSYPFTVRVSDGTLSADKAITLDVTEANAAPVLANVPATATIPELSAYAFTATATDSDQPAQALTFSLVGAPTGATIDATTGAFGWAPTEAQGPGSYPFSVRVSDGVTHTDAPIALTVAEVNTAPVLSGVPASATIPEVSAYTFTAAASDADLPAQALTFSLVGAPAGATIDGTSGVFSWTPTEAQGPGSYAFGVRVSDGVTHADAAITLLVTEVDSPPVLSAVPVTVTIPELSPYTFTATATDADLPAQTLAFSLFGAPAGATINPATGVFSWTPTEAQGPGSYAFTVRVTDGGFTTSSPITIDVTEVNLPPTLSGVPASSTIPELSPYTFTAVGSDPDLPPDPLTYSLVGAPAGASIDATTGGFTWTPSEAQGPGNYTFTVRVSDGTSNADAPIALTVTEVNAAPVISNVPAIATIPELALYTFTATATDSDLPAQLLTFSLVGAPAGAAINGTTGAFSWTPTEVQGPGSYPFSVRVTDGITTTDAPITLTVTEVNTAPVLSGVPASATIPELSAHTFTASAIDSDLPAQALTFSLVGAPAGATIDGATGAFAWTPTEAQGPGSYPFVVRVSDGIDNTDAPITLTVTEVNVAPAMANVPATATIPELSAYTFTATATDADLPAQALAFSLVDAPAGATIDGGTGAFSWTPTEAQGPGSYPFTVRVSDGSAHTDAAITLNVTEVNSLPALSGVPASATISATILYTFTATTSDADLPAQTLTFSLTGAPAGASIGASSGVFSWTPTAAQGPGTYPFSVNVNDGFTTTSSPITLTVLAPVVALTDLAASPVKTANDADGTTKILLNWTAPPSGQTVEVFRASYGGYPRYDDAGGSVPATPSYPPGAPWELTPVTTPGTTDEPSTRGYYDYVAFVHGSGSIVSGVSNKTSGTLDYALGDVSNGITQGTGDNRVDLLDLSLLGAHYGLTGPATVPFAYLDIGPTSDHTVNGLPTTDGEIGFEDLVMFGLDFGVVSAPAGPAISGNPAPVLKNALALEAAPRVTLGDTIQVPIRLSNVGTVEAVSVRLAWNPAKVQPVGMLPGGMMTVPSGIALTPRPGTVDAVFLGARGASIDGTLATVRFATLAAGDPGIHIESVDARDAANKSIQLPVAVTAPVVVLPNVTAMSLAAPNPFQSSTAFGFDLAQLSRVELAIFAVDGRLVRTLVDGLRDAGQYRPEWDGRDSRGARVASGVYYVRLLAGPKRFTRQVVLLQ